MDRESFFSSAPKSKIHEVSIDGIGVVRMKELTESERVNGFDLWIAPNGEIVKKRRHDQRLKMVVLCAVNEQGEAIFTDNDIPRLRDLPAKVVTRLVGVAMECCGLGVDDVTDDEIEKKANS